MARSALPKLVGRIIAIEVEAAGRGFNLAALHLAVMLKAAKPDMTDEELEAAYLDAVCAGEADKLSEKAA
ncbi:MAG: hypothetical protein ACXU82_03640 [Caulobacteraceae bacterium]